MSRALARGMTSTDVYAHGPHGHSDGWVTATGGLRRDEPAAPDTLDPGELRRISGGTASDPSGGSSGGIIDGTRPFPLPRPDGLPSPSPLPLPRPSPTIPLGPFNPTTRPDPV
jgi:hypothetical protein